MESPKHECVTYGTYYLWCKYDSVPYNDKTVILFKATTTGIWKFTEKSDFVLKSGFRVIAFAIFLEVGYVVIIVVNFVYK